MNDVWLPRIICGGLVIISLSAIAAVSLCSAMTTTIETTLLVIASNVVSGLLGYVTSVVTQPKV